MDQTDVMDNDKDEVEFSTHLKKDESLNNDHEYEPVSPPPGPPGPPAVHVTNIEGITIQEPPEGPDAEPIMTDTDSVGSPVRRPVDELPVPLDGDDEDKAMSGGEMGDTNGSLGGPEDEMDEEFMTAAQMQQQMEDRFFAPTPTTTESRTDGEFNTSNVDSSGLEDLPLTKQGRKAKSRFLAGKGRWGRLSSGAAPSGAASSGAGSSGAGPSTSAEGSAGHESIQQRLRSGADRLKTKLSGISRPKMPVVKKPKFTMPDKAKFHLPERPKFKMPERPKFKMPERPKISLGSLGRGSGTARANSTKRPLKSRQQSTESTAGSSEQQPPQRKPLFDLNFKTYPRMFSRKKRGEDRAATPPPPRASFSKDTARWMHRFSEDKYGADDSELGAIALAHENANKKKKKAKKEERKTEPATPRSHASESDQVVYHISLHGSDSEPNYSDDQYDGPPYPEILPIDGDLEVVDHAKRKALAEAEAARRAELVSRQQAEEAARLAQEAAEQMEYRNRVAAARQQNHSPSRYVEEDQDQDNSQDLPASQGDSDRENRSSGTSSERHRRGVIEEIDSDEFFLRQKGISQEDVDMTRYITSEIREALRPVGPVGLSRMDYGDEDDEEELERVAARRGDVPPPPRPQRIRSLRPRKKKGRKNVPATPPAGEPEEEWDDERDESYFNTFPPDRPNRRRRAKKQADEDVENDRAQQDIELSVAISREDLGILALTPTETNMPPPLPPKRLRKSRSSLRSSNLMAAADDVPMIDDGDDWGPDERRVEPEEMVGLHPDADDYIIPRLTDQLELQQEPPVPPTRGRKPRSRGTSLADEDRTSRGAESLPCSERDLDNELPDDIHNEDDILLVHDVDLAVRRIDDYAFVDKQTKQAPPKPDRPRRPKPPRPPAPGRRAKRAAPPPAASRLHNWRQFFSLPTRRSKQGGKQAEKQVPVRPARNYSTLGPARPPRGGTRTSLYTAAYLEIHDEGARSLAMDSHESRADLNSGEVISRMKDRPLPAPPRPPRKVAPRDYEKGDLAEEVLEHFDEKVVPDRYPELESEQDLTYAERKAALAQMREDFFSRSGEEVPEDVPVDIPAPEQVPAIPTITTTSPPPEERPPVLTDSPYKSLRKKKKIPPLPVQEPSQDPEPAPEPAPEPPRPEEVSIAIQTDPLPDDLCVEDAMTTVDDMSRTEVTTSTTGTWPTVVEHALFQQAVPPPGEDAPPPPPPVRRPRRDSHEPTTVRLDTTQHLQVSDLDVERLTVSELRANKITVSEIDGMSLNVAEVQNRSGGLQLGSMELPSDLLQQLLPLSQSMSHALSQSLSESLAQSLSQTLSQIQDSLSQPSELAEQQKVLQQQLQRLQELQSLQQQQQQDLLLHQQQFQQQQQERQHQTLLQVEQQHAEVLHQLQQQLQQLQLAAPQLADVPPPIPPPPRADAQSIQTQTSLESAGPVPIPTVSSPPVAPPRASVRLRGAPTGFDSEEDDGEVLGAAALVPTPSPSHSMRRRRHHTAHRVSTRFSSDEEDGIVVPRRHRGPAASPAEGEAHRGEAPGLGEAGRQLVRACRVSAMHALATLHQTLQPAMDSVGQAMGADPKRRDLQAALCLVLVLVTALILLGCGCAGSKVVHHHHWDFQFPPPL